MIVTLVTAGPAVDPALRHRVALWVAESDELASDAKAAGIDASTKANASPWLPERSATKAISASRAGSARRAIQPKLQKIARRAA